MIFPEGLCPEGNINTEGNISPNPPSGGSINDILYRKLKASKLRIKNLTHTFVNTIFYFRINASIVAFLSNHISFGILMTTFFKICFKILKKPQVLRHFILIFIFIIFYYILFIFCRPCCCHACCLAWSTRIMFLLTMWNIVKRNAGSLIDDVRRDIAINFMLTWHKLSFLIGQFEFEV